MWRRKFAFIQKGGEDLAAYEVYFATLNTEYHDFSDLRVVNSMNPMRNPTRGKRKPDDIYDALYPLLEMKWALWEKNRTKQFARAAEVAETGTYPDMKEDNFSKICRRAGLFTRIRDRSLKWEIRIRLIDLLGESQRFI